MATVPIILDSSNAKTLEELKRASTVTLNAVIEQINGNLTLGANIKAAGPYTVVFKSSSTKVTLNHNLGRVPTGILPVYLTAAAILYAPQSSSLVWTSGTITLQASAAVTATIYVI